MWIQNDKTGCLSRFLNVRNVLRVLGVLGILILLGGCAREEGHDYLNFQAFGTLVEVTLHPASAYDLARIESVLQPELDTLHRAWHAWEPGSLHITNQLLALGQTFQPAPIVVPLILAAQELERCSSGLFNAAMGGLIAVWGFHQDDPTGPPPLPEQIAQWQALPPRMADLHLENGRLRSEHPGVQLDFGGLAKGLAVQRGLERLADLGVQRAIFNAGGDLMTLGRPKTRPWRIAIQHPRQAGGILASLELEGGEALFTSGDYERGYLWEGERIHHILDPRTGYPSQGLTSVTVLHPQPGWADAAATALMIAGPEAWPAVAARLGTRHVLVVRSDGGLEMTPGMADRLTIHASVPNRTVRPWPEASTVMDTPNLQNCPVIPDLSARAPEPFVAAAEMHTPGNDVARPATGNQSP
jgi:thiamine biosynthesis lipoprotein